MPIAIDGSYGFADSYGPTAGTYGITNCRAWRHHEQYEHDSGRVMGR